jgi:hypothetical protein
VHQRHQVGVVEQVGQLVLDVAEVDVDRHGPQLEGGHHGHHPLGRVLAVDPDVVADPDAVVGEVVGQAVGPLLHLRVAEAVVAHHQGGAVAHDVDGALEEVSDVERHPEVLLQGRERVLVFSVG